jgi:hypothetical protein
VRRRGERVLPSEQTAASTSRAIAECRPCFSTTARARLRPPSVCGPVCSAAARQVRAFADQPSRRHGIGFRAPSLSRAASCDECPQADAEETN